MNRFFRFFNSSIRVRILLSYAIVIALVFGMVVLGYYQLNRIRRASDQVVPLSSQMEGLEQVALALSTVDANLERYFLIGGEIYRENIFTEMDSITATVDELESDTLSNMKADMLRLSVLTDSTRNEIDKLMRLDETQATAKDINEKVILVYSKLEEIDLKLQNLITETLSQLQSNAQLQQEITQGLFFWFLGMGIVVSIVGVVASFVITQSIAVPLGKLAEVATQVAAGEFNRHVEVRNEDEIGLLADVFNNMTVQLSNLIGSLEQRVEDRTHALETSTEVSRRLSTILDQDQLVSEVVEQLRSAFGYYHVHIYLVDEFDEHLVMAGGTGDAGRTMLARGHKLEKGSGLVGQAAQNNQVVLIPDVSQADGWLPNPLLPDTKSELAVPISVGRDVLGVLDVQHNIADGLGQQDATLVQAIANQVAVAVQNARAYSQAQHRAEREALVTSVGQRIQSATSIDEVLRVAVSEIGQTLGAKRTKAELKSSYLTDLK